MRSHRVHPRRPRGQWRLCAYAERLLAAGHMGVALCLCCLRILLDSPLRGEALLYADAYAGSVGGFVAVLGGVALGIDWLERVYPSK